MNSSRALGREGGRAAHVPQEVLAFGVHERLSAISFSRTSRRTSNQPHSKRAGKE